MTACVQEVPGSLSREEQDSAIVEHAERVFRLADQIAGRRDDDCRSAAQIAMVRAVRSNKAGHECPLKEFIDECVRRAVRRAISQGKRFEQLDEQQWHDVPAPGDVTSLGEILAELGDDGPLAEAYWVHGHTAAEIAADHGIPLRTLKRRLATTRERLKSLLTHTS